MTVANTYKAGQQVVVSTYAWPLTNPVIGGFQIPNAGQTGFVLADPTTVTVVYRVNQGSPVTLTYPAAITRDGVGLYRAILDTTAQPGIWVGTWHGTGAVLALNTWSFFVVPPSV